MDAAFDPIDPDVVYVVPVQVTVADSGHTYVAAAKLRLTGGGDYDIEALYGDDPSATSTHTITDSSTVLGFLHEPDLQHLQEVETDATGRNLFVLSGCWHNHNNWVIIYDTESHDPQGTKIWLNEPDTGSAGLVGPSAMVVSAVHDTLYLVSSAQNPTDRDDLATKIYCFRVAQENEQVTGLTFDHTITVHCSVPGSRICNLYPRLCEEGQSTATLTSLAEDPVSGTLYAVGFSAPKFKEDARWPTFGTTLFTTPLLTVVRPEEPIAEAIALEDESLLLPLSVIFTGNADLMEEGL